MKPHNFYSNDNKNENYFLTPKKTLDHRNNNLRTPNIMINSRIQTIGGDAKSDRVIRNGYASGDNTYQDEDS